MVCALAHNDYINWLLLFHLLLSDLFAILCTHGEQIIIEVAHANRAGFIIICFSLFVFNLFLHFFSKLVCGHLYPLGQLPALAFRQISEWLRGEDLLLSFFSFLFFFIGIFVFFLRVVEAYFADLGGYLGRRALFLVRSYYLGRGGLLSRAV